MMYVKLYNVKIKVCINLNIVKICDKKTQVDMREVRDVQAQDL